MVGLHGVRFTYPPLFAVRETFCPLTGWRSDVKKVICVKEYGLRVPAGRPPARAPPPERDSRDGVACCPYTPYTPHTSLIVSTLQLKQQTETLYTFTPIHPKPDPYTADPQHVTPRQQDVYSNPAQRIHPQQHPDGSTHLAG